MDLAYIINELGEEREQYFEAVAPPIIQSSNFASKTVADMRYKMKHEEDEYMYSRGNNPTVTIFEKKMAALEGAEHAVAFGSGMGAIAAAVLSQVKAGDHVVCVKRPYTWAKNLMRKFLPRFGVEVTMVDGKDIVNFKEAMRPNTKLLYLESPTSFTFELQDLSAVAAFAKENNCVTIIDNSFASPLHQNPIAFGIDLVVHSCTKYIGGHSDVMGGVVCGSREHINQIFKGEFLTLGAVLSPHDAWLFIRGLRTLPVRMERVAASTHKVVSYLTQHPKVEQVLFPFLPTHPQYELAQRQMRDNSGQFSLYLKAARMEQVDKFCDSLKHFLMAASWGGHESLIFPVSATYASEEMKSDLPFNMVRFYVGLEEPEYLIKDLEQALDKM
ncbi:aminotransferase class V-fold PLP-dependent enzyme [Pontibacter diazotrophicus]|uniref:Aminotransferase class V-fold PLP-dependent enzyme n=1 Tax=Pontibacter diazotrophicus TaxID=1400979 RepID=A0A3D8LJA8_9BACT|nr:aminotransferase class I/II-fold pyridoxal phosphate-dependent enzyme [Pontibacter diazotrophicus]RDV17132.1 aminotransferase class V-fold PLP-dependent enzyme [Pontibacter diazotrophicus]